MKQEEKSGLCFRCEHRAKFLEKGIRPRYECGEIEDSKFSCYMFKPVKPVVTAKLGDDDRPKYAGSLFSARSRFVEVAQDVGLEIEETDTGDYIYWAPKQKEMEIKDTEDV